MSDTRLTLRNLVRSLVNEEMPSTATADTDGGFWSNATINNILNRAQSQIYNDMLNHYTKYFITVGTVATVPAQNYVAFPTNAAYRIERLSYNGIDIMPAQAREINTSFVNTGPTPQCFYIEGSKIYLSPVPTLAINLDIEYWRKPTDMSTDASVPDLPDEAHQLVAWGAAVICLKIAGDMEVAQAMDKQYRELKNQVLCNLVTAQTYDSPRIITGTSNFGLFDV
jgi:hypothetical protein